MHADKSRGGGIGVHRGRPQGRVEVVRKRVRLSSLPSNAAEFSSFQIPDHSILPQRATEKVFPAFPDRLCHTSRQTRNQRLTGGRDLRSRPYRGFSAGRPGGMTAGRLDMAGRSTGAGVEARECATPWKHDRWEKVKCSLLLYNKQAAALRARSSVG